MWSPTSSVGIIDPDGIWNASTTNARSNSATAMATPIDSAYSRSVDLRANDRWSSITSSSVMLALRMRSTSAAADASTTPCIAARTVAATAPGNWAPFFLRMRRASFSRWRDSSVARRIAERRRHHARKPAGGSPPPRAGGSVPPPRASPRSPWVALISIDFEDGEEGFLRNLHVAHLFHPLLTFLLTLQQLALASYVAAVALGGNVFS